MALKKLPINTNKLKQITPVALIVIMLIAVGFLGFKQLTKKDTAGLGTTKTACELLTSQLVKKALGKDYAMVPSKNNVAETDQNGVKVSTCEYKEKGGNDGSETVAVLTIKSAQSKDGITTVKALFAKKPKGYHDVSGYKYPAYWAPATGETSVLKGSTLYLMRSGPNTPRDPDIDDTNRIVAPLLVKLP